MNQEMKQKYMALAILVNSCNLNRAQFCAELRKITSLDHLLFVLDRITNEVALRRGVNVFIHHKDFTLRALFTILPESHYLDHQDMLGEALLRHKDFCQKQLCMFLELVGPDVGMYIIDLLTKDRENQHFLIDILRKYKYPKEYIRSVAEAIICHPIPIEQLSDLIAQTDHMGAKLAFAKAAAQIENLDTDVLRGFFRQIEGDAQREVAFIEAAHMSAGETFFVLLIETELEPTRKACIRKLEGCTHSLATIEYWRDCAENHANTDAVRWFDILLIDRYETIPLPQLLDILDDLKDSERVKRDMIINILSRNTYQLREIAGIAAPK